jgi:hypothetical protein
MEECWGGGLMELWAGVALVGGGGLLRAYPLNPSAR